MNKTKEKTGIIQDFQTDSGTFLFSGAGDNKRIEGGLRTKGFFKESHKNKPLVSIVTVVYNGEKYLEETIVSVINQKYDNVEYIIIDGGSNDKTLEIIKKYEENIDYWVSENDDGIYDAMNKGIDLVGGDWINFMNAGDEFYNHKTISIIFDKKILTNELDIIYGDLQVNYGNYKKKLKAIKLDNLYKGMAFSHQSCFIRSTFHKKNKYDLKYKITSDFNLVYTAYREKSIFQYENVTIASVIPDGLSDSNHLKVCKENFNIVNQGTLLWYQKVYYYLKYFNIAIKNIIKRVIGNKMTKKLRKII